MTDKPAESAVERYEKLRDWSMGAGKVARDLAAKADAALAELKAKLAAAEEVAAGQRQAYIDTKIALAAAEARIEELTNDLGWYTGLSEQYKAEKQRADDAEAALAVWRDKAIVRGKDGAEARAKLAAAEAMLNAHGLDLSEWGDV